ncbi:pseudouridine synthase [Shewanella psychrotolerans]|uniref:pseudouridine synthase n=1 Tax=Shewanella psychrotolerans TaxID=2864206 RepID=UPI001C6561AA|nr:pseudouridine synthase [Shewanella psychrotolerans]QYK00388.1 pseudouridine synthase [Shewanella psychrotolerans]
MRLDKFVCKSTTLNRQQAVLVISAGEVTVNGNAIVDAAVQVHESNCIEFQGERLLPRPFRYILLNKPKSTLCSNVDGDYPSIFNLLNVPNPDELHIAGRLDADTTGLVLITDDGRWSFNVFNPKYHCQKVYRVRLRDSIEGEHKGEIDGQLVARFKQGLQLPGETKLTLPAKLVYVSEREALLTISEGRYHQVKRMFAAVGNRVVGLHRERVGSIECDVACGEWRYLSDIEVEGFGFSSLSELDNRR